MAASKTPFLLQNLDDILLKIAHCEFYTKIAADYDVSFPTLYKFLNSTDEIKKRFEEAREMSAQIHIEKSLKVLEEIDSSSTAADCLKAREIAHAHRKFAAFRNRKEYSENYKENEAMTTINIIPAQCASEPLLQIEQTIED